MTKKCVLDFQGTKFTVPKCNLLDLFEHRPKLITSTSCEVQRSVPVEIFGVIAKTLETGGKVPVTKENAGTISVPVNVLCLEDLLSDCSALQLGLAPEFIAALPERISKLEHQISSQP
jgi:hypothetical protein